MTIYIYIYIKYYSNRVDNFYSNNVVILVTESIDRSGWQRVGPCFISKSKKKIKNYFIEVLDNICS